MVELLAVDAALGPELLAVVELVLARHHRDRNPALRLGDLDRHAAEAARAAQTSTTSFG